MWTITVCDYYSHCGEFLRFRTLQISIPPLTWLKQQNKRDATVSLINCWKTQDIS